MEQLGPTLRPPTLLQGGTAALLQARPLAAAPIIIAGPISVDQEHAVVHVAGRQLQLTAKEFALIALFASYPGRTFSRADLLSLLREGGYEVAERSVDTHVQRLRKKLSESASMIQTIWALGYKLELASSP